MKGPLRPKGTVARHEMGHTMLALLLFQADPVHRVSSIPRWTAPLGTTLQLPLSRPLPVRRWGVTG